MFKSILRLYILIFYDIASYIYYLYAYKIHSTQFKKLHNCEIIVSKTFKFAIPKRTACIFRIQDLDRN